MKKCAYCGAEYSDEMVECLIDREPLARSAQVQTKLTNEQERIKHQIPPLVPMEKDKEWATIVIPRDNFEANIVMGRLKSSGIKARLYASVIGGWIGQQTQTFVQVRPTDYEAARVLLNASTD